jgi:hypothetical protein
VLAGRHDPVSPVREAAISAALAFECLEKLCPQSAIGLGSNAIASYDFVPPNPPGYAFSSKRWAKSTVSTVHDAQSPTRTPTPPLPSQSQEEESSPDFDDSGVGDEAAPSHHERTDENDHVPATNSDKQAKFVRAASVLRATATAAEPKDVAVPSEMTQDDERFMDLLVDQAAAPENGDEASYPSAEGVGGSRQELLTKGSNARNGALASSIAARTATNERPRPSAATAVQAVATLKQFAAKQRADARSRRAQHQELPQIALPKRRSFQIPDPSAVNQGEGLLLANQGVGATKAGSKNTDNNASDLELTRAEAALEAAQCGEDELALRLCIVEDDLELLRRAMTLIGTPCMTRLSTAVHNALCTALLALLDGDEASESSDVWLALQWLQQWAADRRHGRRQFSLLDPRVIQALSSKLHQLSMSSTKASLAAAHVLFLLGV